jgi:hypothetical protein
LVIWLFDHLFVAGRAKPCPPGFPQFGRVFLTRPNISSSFFSIEIMFKIITVPFDRVKNNFDEELLNRMTLNKQVKSSRGEFFQDGEDAYGMVFLEYDPLLAMTPEHAVEGKVFFGSG